jgi:lipoyl synthase
MQDSRSKTSKLNILPPVEENSENSAVKKGRFPSWLHRPLAQDGTIGETHHILKAHRLPTVCEEAKCPNLYECYSKKTATFLAMGKQCTRNCGFCDIDFSKQPSPLDEDEPNRLATSVQALGLKHVVVTMVARDDLPDGGAQHLVKIIEAVRAQNTACTIEVLTSDFGGNTESYDAILKAKPEIYNHNIETVRLLTPRVRHRATYERTLHLLKYIHERGVCLVKSGFMVGLGESTEEVKETLRDLREVGCDIVTIGHYLQANRHKLTVKSFITPQQFEEYAHYGKSIGIKHVYAGPFVRSSYNADAVFNTFLQEKTPNV